MVAGSDNRRMWKIRRISCKILPQNIDFESQGAQIMFRVGELAYSFVFPDAGLQGTAMSTDTVFSATQPGPLISPCGPFSLTRACSETYLVRSDSQAIDGRRGPAVRAP